MNPFLPTMGKLTPLQSEVAMNTFNEIIIMKTTKFIQSNPDEGTDRNEV
jgi:hypothetical protein